LARWTNLSETTFVLQPDHTALAKIGFNVGIAGVNRPDGAIALIARLGRAGRVHLERDASGQVWVGGHSVSCIVGERWG
jgi:predicted PhzF superfamily epimerase YddE/YHI9